MKDILSEGLDRIKIGYVWAALRIGLGWLLLWAFLDKLFGLGFATSADGAWINGGSPTTGFLKFGTSGIFSSFFESLAGNAAVDALFMAALLLIGTALILGIGMKIATLSGAVLMFILYLSNVPPVNNPLIDEHIIYIIALIGLAKVKAGQWIGLGEWWSSTKLVKRFPILE
ncbi:MAG TPA: hypothetical protein VMW26_06975 [Methanomassiliicoccales archaeon]|nr:hypothetical protein [Methanomassiliicoccales archaeon]